MRDSFSFSCASGTNRGATLVEFSLVFSMLIIFVLIAIQILMFCYTAIALQFVAARSLRAAVIGPPPSAASGAGAGGGSDEEVIENRVLSLAADFFVPVEAWNVHVCAIPENALPPPPTSGEGEAGTGFTGGGAATGVNYVRSAGSPALSIYQCAVDDAGESGSVVAIHVFKDYQIPLLGKNVTLEAIAVGRNEPY